MSPQHFPPDLLDFLRRRIAGADELEVLLLLRSDASRSWTPADLARRFALTEAWAEPMLEDLRDAELLDELDGDAGERRFVYGPDAPEHERVMATLAEIYEERRADIMRILNENAVERIRAAAVRTFGGAFDLRKGESAGKRRNGGHGKPGRGHGKRSGGWNGGPEASGPGTREPASPGDEASAKEQPGTPRGGRHDDGHVDGSGT